MVLSSHSKNQITKICIIVGGNAVFFLKLCGPLPRPQNRKKVLVVKLVSAKTKDTTVKLIY